MSKLFANYTPTGDTYVTILGVNGQDFIDQKWDDLVTNNPSLFKTIDSTPESGSQPTITVHTDGSSPDPSEMEIKETAGGTFVKHDLSPYSGGHPTRPS